MVVEPVRERGLRDLILLSSQELAVWTTLVLALGFFAVLSHGGFSARAAAQVVLHDGERAPLQLLRPPAWRMNLNTATEAELVLLPGVGPARARAIIAERERRGSFRAVSELAAVRGFTPALARRLEPLVCTGTD